MKLRVHKSITASRVLEAAEREMYSLDNPGLCIACGEEAEGVEPDAEQYECESCGSHRVYGASQLLIMGAYHEDGQDKRTE